VCYSAGSVTGSAGLLIVELSQLLHGRRDNPEVAQLIADHSVNVGVVAVGVNNETVTRNFAFTKNTDAFLRHALSHKDRELVAGIEVFVPVRDDQAHAAAGEYGFTA